MELLFLLITLPIVTMWHGFIFMTLWGWFIVPTFGLAPLTLAVAIGVALVVRMLTISFKVDAKSPDVIKGFFTGMFGYAIFLLIGWIVKGFM